MQTRVFPLKLRTVNRGKAARLAAMQQAFTEAVRLHLHTAYTLPKPVVSSLHAACYHEARARFSLPASTIQQARDKALAIYRSVQTRKRQGKQALRPRLHRVLPLRIAVENLRVFSDKSRVRLTMPEGFLWLPVIIPDAWHAVCALPHAVSEFVCRGRDWYLLLAVKSEDVPAPDGLHFGLDLGVANLAVLSGPHVV
jgi:putative transposase